MESAARDTAENAAFSARLLKADGIARVALVSHAWHLPRAVELFEREGLEAHAAPTGFATGKQSLFAKLLPSSGALHEWLGILVQRLMR